MTIVVRELGEIKLDKLARLRICESLGDVWTWAISAPVQATQPPLAARTMPQRLAMLKEEIHRIQVSLVEQCEVMDAMAKDLSRFTICAAKGISQLLDSARAAYMRYSETHVPYQRHMVRQRTGEASTLQPHLTRTSQTLDLFPLLF
ncbi:hypothetical protein Tco_1407232 [Tanacetum coccineum]